MYIIRKTVGKRVSFKTFNGWTHYKRGVSLDLQDVMRFTKGEAKQFNLRANEDFISFGCYKELKDE